MSVLLIVLYYRLNLQLENMNWESFCCAPLILHGGSIRTTSKDPTLSAKKFQLKNLTSQLIKVLE